MILSTKQILILILLLLPNWVLSGEQQSPRLKLLHPKQDMQFWVNQIEVAGDIPKGTEVSIGDSIVVPDEDGRFRTLLTLDQDTTLIPILEKRKNLIFRDTIRVFHRAIDHMMQDSVFINNNIPKDLAIHFTYPNSGKFYSHAVGLRGWTHPEAILTMNGDTLHVYPSGAFTTLVQVNQGTNEFDFRASWNDQTVSKRLTLDRPLTDDASSKSAVHNPMPSREQWVMTDDYLQVGIQGPPNKAVSFKIPGVISWQALTEIKPGHYATSIQLRGIDQEINTRVIYRFSRFSKRIVSAPLRILTEPMNGITTHEDSRVYDGPSTNQLLFPLADSVSLQVIGKENRMFRIRLGEYRTAYVREDRTALLPDNQFMSPHYLGPMKAENDSDWTLFRIHTGNRRQPFEIKEKAVPSRLQLKVYGAKQGWEWTTYPEDDSAIAFVERSQPEDLVWQMDFYPKQSFWGWFARYEGQYLVIGIRKAPSISPDSLFAGIKIEIDPGHGGWQRGALGITGYAEADANLHYSLMLEKLLTNAGATVYLTRHADQQVSLAQRAEKARNDSVHIFIMAHNNAPGTSADLLTAKGSSTFYTWPSSKALCDNIYPYLGEMGIDTSGKVLRYYYYLTRQTEYLVYLIEGGFMTYPNEEMFLLSEEGLQKLADAAFQGLEDFLREQATDQ